MSVIGKLFFMVLLMMGTSFISDAQIIIYENTDADVQTELLEMSASIIARAANEAVMNQSLSDAKDEFSQFLERNYSKSDYDSRNVANVLKVSAATVLATGAVAASFAEKFPYMTAGKRDYVLKKIALITPMLVPMLTGADAAYVTNADRQRIIANTKNIVREQLAGMDKALRYLVIVYAFKVLVDLTGNRDSKFVELIHTIADF